ncbi:Ribosomal RNA large subunit methyltransferase I [Pelotomaculum sp. FP]|uniref:class I SAM-dependent methyltransferase n=1 Tax=Pelotomaculum sp. FP TaxID=261474 RepID=UPI0011041CA7|nr:class I SAM-dependent methyltransferase [Pelotomaculum sp. FP]TEB14497.1 Ribosomal RNA large subunit methyltransferase I [Pelotomaculum sp. FP]
MRFKLFGKNETRHDIAEFIYKNYYKTAYYTAYKYCDNHAMAEEAAQETIFQAIKNFDQLKDSGKLESWVKAIARNTVLNKTGYFLDQRENRMALRGLAEGARVLDCFCHTGTFIVYAAAYGAREVLGVDMAGPALDVARRNASRNGFEEVCSFREANAFDELRALEKAGERYDLVILDPPAFTKSKQALRGAVRGYKESNLRGMKLLPPGGFLVTCSCSFHMREEQFMEVILEAAKDAGRQLRLVELRRQAKDHPTLPASPETHYLKCAVLQVW